jgi:pyruvate ferredoxin oxidoreductase alpha subunit
MESKKQQHEAIKRAKKVVVEVGKEYGKLSGRKYGLFENYKPDADVALSGHSTPRRVQRR